MTGAVLLRGLRFEGEERAVSRKEEEGKVGEGLVPAVVGRRWGIAVVRARMTRGKGKAVVGCIIVTWAIREEENEWGCGSIEGQERSASGRKIDGVLKGFFGELYESFSVGTIVSIGREKRDQTRSVKRISRLEAYGSKRDA